MTVIIYETDVKTAIKEFMARRGVEIKEDHIEFRCYNGSTFYSNLTVRADVSNVELPLKEGPYR